MAQSKAINDDQREAQIRDEALIRYDPAVFDDIIFLLPLH
jgi:hypothetical protein